MTNPTGDVVLLRIKELELEKETDSGSIEVFASFEDAQRRNDDLAGFDGVGMLNPGSHRICGTIVVRTSSFLTASQQKELEQQIIEK